MSRFSVKKPLTVVVGVIIVLIMGYMAFTNLSTDLLPSMNLPYAVVMTTYGGASPEEVEEVVTKPIESSMATVSNIKHITSTSSENYSMVVLEFNNSANMDAVTIEMRESLDLLGSYWPDTVGSPIIMKMNPSMLPVMMVAVSGEGMSTSEVSDLVNDYVQADIESLDGVASVSASGLLEESVQVIIREDRVETLNEKLKAKINEKFEEAGEEIADGRQQLEEGRQQLADGKAAANAQMAQAEAQINSGQAALASGQAQLDEKKAEMESGEAALEAQEAQFAQLESALSEAEAELAKQQAELDALPDQLAAIEANEADLKAKRQQLEDSIAALQEEKEFYQQLVNAANSELGNIVESQLTAQKGVLEQQLEAVKNDTSLSEEEKATKVTEINNSIGNIQYLLDKFAKLREDQSQLDKINGQIATAQAGLEAIDKGLQEADALKNQVEAAIAAAPEMQTQLDAAKTKLEGQRTDLNEGKSKLQDGKTTFEQGKEALAAVQSELDANRSKLGSAQSQLSGAKAQAQAELNSAEAQLSEGESELNVAESQMEEAREEALDNVHMEDVITTDIVKNILTAQNFSMPAGYVTEDGVSYMVRVGDKIGSLEDAQNLVLMDLSDQDLGVIYLKDVADVVVTDNSADIYAKMDGDNAVLLSIEKQTDFSTADVAKLVRKYMTSDKVSGYGLSMTALMDQGVYIDMVIESVLNNLIIGGILAIIILIFFLKDIKPTAVVAISIPVSVVFALALMYFTGVTMNIISLSGLALGVGMLVDNSIVVIENIYRLRHLGVPAHKAAIQGAKQVTGAIIASTLTTICIWTPIIFTEGITKQLFVDLVLTIAYSLLASLIVALTVVPMVSSRILDKTKERKHGLFDKVVNGYGKALRWALKYKIVVLAVVIVLFVGSIVGVLSKGMEFMGDMDSTQISVSIKMDEDTPLDQTAAMSDEVMNRLLTLDDVDHVGVMAGSSISVMSSSSSTDSATMYVILKEDKTHTSKEVAAQIEDMMADLDCEVTASGSTMDMSALGGSGISVMIKGRDIDTLKAIADDVAGKLENIEGTIEVSNGQEHPVAELRVTVDKEKAMLHSLTVAQVYQQLAAMIKSPTAATTISDNNKDYDITVIDEADSTMDRNELKKVVLKTTNAEGESVEIPLSDIATFTDDTGLSSIRRDAQQRYISVSCGIDEDHNATLVARELKSALKDFELPDGYSMEFSGEDESTQEAVQELVKLLALGIVIMYLIMVAQFQSLLSPFIVLFTIPLAFTGGFLSLILTNNILSVIAMVGFVMLCGIIVNNGIVFIDYANQLRDAGMPKREALVITGKTRLRPILMTAMTTILAMSTMALGIGSGSDMVQPMAIVTIGGLIYGTFMTLFVVPVIYDIFNRKERKNVVTDDTVEIDLAMIREDNEDKKTMTDNDIIPEIYGNMPEDSEKGSDTDA